MTSQVKLVKLVTTNGCPVDQVGSSAGMVASQVKLVKLVKLVKGCPVDQAGSSAGTVASRVKVCPVRIIHMC